MNIFHHKRVAEDTFLSPLSIQPANYCHDTKHMRYIQQFIKILAFSSIKVTFETHFFDRKANSNTFNMQQHVVSLKRQTCTADTH